MDKQHLQQYLDVLASNDDQQSIMGLRALQSMFQEQGVTLEKAINYAAGNLEDVKKNNNNILESETVIEQEFTEQAAPDQPASGAQQQAAGQPDAPKPPSPAGAATTELPNCRSLKPGVIEFVPPHQPTGVEVNVIGEPAEQASDIAEHIRDAFVAAVLNKTTFKIKLNDIKDNHGEIIETIVQAEYARDNMTPVKIWTGDRGAAGTLASAIRQGLKQAMPDMLT